MKIRWITTMMIMAVLMLGSTAYAQEKPVLEDNAVMEAASASEQARVKQTIKTPVEVYGVAVRGKSFNLNATAKTNMSYYTSNSKIAKVSKNGTVTVGKAGVANITIRAEKTDRYASAKKVVKVRVSEYSKPCGKILQSAGDMDGRLGDSSGREVASYPYVHGKAKWKNWCFVVRCTDPYISNHAARAFEYIAQNNSFGHQTRDPKNQNSIDLRASTYKAVHKAVGDNPSYDELKKILNIRTKTSTSCTPNALAGYWLYIDMNTKLNLKWIPPYNKRAYKYYCGAVNVEYHQLETAIKQVNSEYRKAGKIEPFEIIYISKSNRNSFFKKSSVMRNLKRGDLLCSAPNPAKGGHTVMLK